MYDAGLYLVVYRVDPFQQTGRCGYGQSHWAVATYCAYRPPDVAWCWPLPGQDSHIVLERWSRREGRGGEGGGGEKRRGERKESHRSSCSIKVPLPHFKFTSLTQMEPLPTLMVGHEHGFLRGHITYQGLHSVRHRVKLYEEMIFYCMYLVSPSQAPL